MWTYLILGAIAVLVTASYLLRRGPSADSLVSKAMESGDIGPVVQAAAGMAAARRSVFYQQAIRQMWEGWQRPLAIQLVKEYAVQHSHEKICQYWLKQAMEVEPAMARKFMDERFLASYYQPKVAAECGRTSS